MLHHEKNKTMFSVLIVFHASRAFRKLCVCVCIWYLPIDGSGDASVLKASGRGMCHLAHW